MFRNTHGEPVRVTGIGKGDALVAYVTRTPLFVEIDGMRLVTKVVDFRQTIDPGVLELILHVRFEERCGYRVHVPCYVLRGSAGGMGYVRNKPGAVPSAGN